MYPNFVDTINRMKPVLTWEDFKKTTIARVSTSKRVLEEFWWHFKCLLEDRAEADVVLELKFKNMVPKILSEEKRAITKKLYKDGNMPLEDVDEYRNRWPTKEALISAKPRDFTPMKALKTGIDPEISGAWMHNHELNLGTNDGRLCNQNAANKWVSVGLLS
ncbi:hypothetical protein BDA96_10G156300 [Sorghum bicolor]|uniref:Uncharacterized protein n=1 Tax=Sorghum bicolor TaxID=4558 RepID=A0A921Q346_SORBI|nr:hypothetical protein BDA96_10G156300 [Sorghum bicolor]